MSASNPDAPRRPRLSPPVVMDALARRLGCTQGQAYSLVVVVSLGLVLASLGLPAALADRPAATRLTQPASPIAPTPSPRPTPAEPPPLVVGVDPFPPPLRVEGSPAPTSERTTGTTAAVPQSRSLANDTGQFGAVFTFAAVPDPGSPAGVVVSDESVYVATDNGPGRGNAKMAPRVFRFTGAGVASGAFAGSAVPPGSARGISDLAVTAEGALLGLAPTRKAVLRLSIGEPGAMVFGRIPDIPACIVVAAVSPCEPGVVDNEPLPVAVAASSTGAVFVADAGQATVWRFGRAGGEPLAVHSHDDYSLDGELRGVAVDGANRLVISATRSQRAGGGGALYVLDPTTGGRSDFATTGADSAPTGIAIGRTGRVYVALAGAGRVLTLAPDGKEVARFPGAAEPGWETPVDVALRGQSLLVTVQSPGDAAKARVLRVAVGERPVA